MALFPRIFHNEFAQVARLMDEIASYQVARPAATAAIYYPTNGACRGGKNGFRSHFQQQQQQQQPRFDIKENKDSYELSGELPGYTDVNVEFTDASTLRIKGRSEHSREEGAKPAQLTGSNDDDPAAIADWTTTTAADMTKTDAATTSSNTQYHKASVEEDENWVDAGANEDVSTAATAATEATPSSSTTVTAPEASTLAAPETPAPAKNESRYWLSERSIGEFARTFTFPARVNQEAVKASLKNGILSVVVPKALPATRRINVE